MMHLVLLGIIAGIAGTLAMDGLNSIFSRTGVLLKIDIIAIGRMAAGWLRGRFLYNHPSELEPAGNERLLGYVTHYAISVIFALLYVLGWHFLVGGPVSAFWALVFGLATSVAPLFVVLPSMGLGALGKHSPDGIRAPLSSLVNHLFFGIGMAAAIAIW